MKRQKHDNVRVFGALAVIPLVAAFIYFDLTGEHGLLGTVLLVVAGIIVVTTQLSGSDDSRSAEEEYLEAHPADRKLLNRSETVESIASWGIIVFGLLLVLFANLPRWEGWSWAAILFGMVGVVVVCTILSSHSRTTQFRIFRRLRFWNASQPNKKKDQS